MNIIRQRNDGSVDCFCNVRRISTGIASDDSICADPMCIDIWYGESIRETIYLSPSDINSTFENLNLSITLCKGRIVITKDDDVYGFDS